VSSIIKNKKEISGTIEGLEGGNFYAYIARMKYITRWGLMRNTEKENIQEHSLEVAILAHALCLIRNEMYAEEPAKKLDPEKACLFAVFHDSDEIITGDLPTPIKYANPVIRDNYHDIEAQSKEKLLSMLPEKLQPVYRNILFFDENSPEYRSVVKAADRLSAYIKCVEECKAGNAEFTKARQTVLDSMRAMNLPELDYFIDHFLPAYSLTLDELEKRK
jgi:5'-deoxynucleotidase